jgi:hypothetical protein
MVVSTLKKMNYKILLKTSHKFANRQQRCVDTWLKDVDVLCITDKITDIHIPQMSCSDKDTHGISSEEKTVFIFNHIKNNNKQYANYDWFVFIDDDAILNINMLNHILPFLDKNFIYGLNMRGSYPKDKSLIYPSGGAGYIVSSKTIFNTPHMINYKYFHEDVSVGRYMLDNNINLSQFYYENNIKHKIIMGGWFPYEKLKSHLPEDLIKNYTSNEQTAEYIINITKDDDVWRSKIKNSLTHHYIRTDLLMKHIHNIFNNK